MFTLLVIVLVGVLLWTNVPVRDAVRRRIGGDTGDESWREEVEDLRAEVADLRLELQETRERLEFAERLLASPRRRDRERLEGGALVIDRSG